MITYRCCIHCATEGCDGRLCFDDNQGCPHGTGLCVECAGEACDDCRSEVPC